MSKNSYIAYGELYRSGGPDDGILSECEVWFCIFTDPEKVEECDDGEVTDCFLFLVRSGRVGHFSAVVGDTDGDCELGTAGGSSLRYPSMSRATEILYVFPV